MCIEHPCVPLLQNPVSALQRFRNEVYPTEMPMRLHLRLDMCTKLIATLSNAWLSLVPFTVKLAAVGRLGELG